jgi:hypothetical protein
MLSEANQDAAIDAVIRKNHIHRACLGLWLDWMAQGTRVSANAFYENGRDLFVEVNHGPFVVDNNLFLSPASLLDMSEGGAYMHNLFNGTIVSAPEFSRQTPYHPAHSTTVAGLSNVHGGDCRFYNNLFVGPGERSAKENTEFGLASYSKREPGKTSERTSQWHDGRKFELLTCFVVAGEVRAVPEWPVQPQSAALIYGKLPSIHMS